MLITHDQVFGYSPAVYMQFRFPMTDFPMVFNVSGDCTTGNSSGYGVDAVLGGFGEYIERYHFYTGVKSQCNASLYEVNTPELSYKLIQLINQIKRTQDKPLEYKFDLTKVNNIFTNKIAYVPTGMISLAHSDSNDREFIPFIDSCGQATHISKKASFITALKEFIERQSLVGAWLSERVVCQIKINTHDALNDENKIIFQLMKHGELYAFNINNHLPGYCIIIFYFSHSDKDNVCYSVGMAADLNPITAIKRAAQELWQSYLFMYLNAEKSENLDQRYKYLNELILFNNHDTKNKIPFFKHHFHQLGINQFLSEPIFSQNEIMKQLNLISHDVFLYRAVDELMGKKFYFSKIISPDFFLHMGVTMPMNIDNRYANLLKIPTDIKITHPIPFP